MASDVTVRELQEDDAAAVQLVQSRNRLSSCDPETWKHLWTQHPFRQAFAKVPWGWALVSKAEGMVGTCSNVHLMYEFAGQQILGAVAASWAVDPKWRSAAFAFGAQFYRQRNVDLLINGSTSRVVSQLMTAYGMQRIPTPDSDTRLLWVCNYRKFLEAVFIKKHLPPKGVLIQPCATAMRLMDAIRGRRTPPPHGKIVRLQTFDERFDQFWLELLRGPAKLRAVRNAAMLRWRFPGESSPILTLERSGKMVGYLVLSRGIRSHLGSLQQYSIQDWQLLEQNSQDAQDLLVAAIATTQTDSVDLLSLSGFDSWKRTQAMRLHPLRHSIGYWPAYFKSPRPAFQEQLTDPQLWDFSLFEAF